MNTVQLVARLSEQLTSAGLRGSFLVRHLGSAEEVGIEPDLLLPIASLVKVPLAMAVLDLAARGELDLAERIEVPPPTDPDVLGPGPGGLSRFHHTAGVAVQDLLHLAVALSDNVAADALFRIVSPVQVTRYLRGIGLDAITVRHRVADLSQTPAERLAGEPQLAQALAIGGRTEGGGHPVRVLDVSRASTGTARGFADLLEIAWAPGSTRVRPEVAHRVRTLLGQNVMRQRLAPDLASDTEVWSSKTGTVLNLRHEVGVVEHADGECYVVTALTESRVPAVVQPAAEAAMGEVARRLRDHLRAGLSPPGR